MIKGSGRAKTWPMFDLSRLVKIYVKSDRYAEYLG